MGLGIARDEADARRRFAMACEQGSLDGCRRTAELEQMGRGGPRNPDAAVGRFAALCSQSREQRDCHAAEAAKQLKERMTPLPPSVDDCDGATAGGLEKKVIGDTIQSYAHEARYCYEIELNAGREIEGEVVLQFVIGELGSVETADTQYSIDALAWTARCVAEQARSWRFPPPKCGGKVSVRFPFMFKMQEKAAAQ